MFSGDQGGGWHQESDHWPLGQVQPRLHTAEVRLRPSQVSSASSCCGAPHGQHMYSERLSPCQLLARSEGRVAFAGTVLASIQAVGFVLSLYLLVSSYTSEAAAEDPRGHVCVEAALCLLFRYGPGLHQTLEAAVALAGQCVYSLVAVAANTLLVGGALASSPGALVPWLVLYGLVTAGSLVLSVVVALTILLRDTSLGDVRLVTVLWFTLPLAIFIMYTLLWCFVFSVYRKFKSYKKDIYYVRT